MRKAYLLRSRIVAMRALTIAPLSCRQTPNTTQLSARNDRLPALKIRLLSSPRTEASYSVNSAVCFRGCYFDMSLLVIVGVVPNPG
ncbi:uncharacterized protein K460DRAFT_122415 [Cucurbitaria berberidis CBS 394.84]|uniref:Uncharacterized protein n=1 Tax=Cucurbitaria berberidis CBS 394.84 TaxID=1168544 RepID=A0A9P4GJI2_9PLEO|nr:uncharacterized protein K460DRAFT_122415 [Cucurbitaria berberidis CBS 394.84]KAF1846265.1 hypothetical protein K460DRAFT_122415 [Cucurbitaria berberidis CBS 394.84]